ncbi:PAS domain-containing protein [Bacillaceae bacterium Marseille-Q3522]|nr:PAS domain-containing protein [Bacillaceae bacterium Marseille-Q3522]
MTKYGTKLLIMIISVILIVIIALGISFGYLFNRYYLHLFDDRIQKESQLIINDIQNNGGISSVNKENLTEYSNVFQINFALLSEEGSILFDNGVFEGSSAENLDQFVGKMLKKEELEYFNTEKNFHYYWRTIDPDQPNDGYIFVKTELSELENINSNAWWILLLCVSIVLIFIGIFIVKITSRYTKPIVSATNVAIELAKGNYQARADESRWSETALLSSSINVLARNLEELRRTQEMHQDRLMTLIENIGSPLILIDSRGYISLINRTYKELFHVNPDEYLYKLYYEVIQRKEITRLIEEIFITEQKVKKQLVIPIGIERRHFQVYAVPIIGTNNVWKGILLVLHDITELKKLEQIRKDFVANVSHELKTPITSIRGFSETLLDGAMDDQESLQYFLHIILAESDRLQALIDDLLELSRIEQQGFALLTEDFNTVLAVKEVLSVVNMKASEKQIELQLQADVDPFIIEGNVRRFKQICINLISNAIAYTPAGGHVTVRLKNFTEFLLLEVQDTGIGIEKDEIPRIFERFYRVDKARSRESGGTGLGLAIVKHLVEVYKGQITVESKIGKGTVFRIKFNKKFPE